jgi:riboflavin kinase
MGALHAPSEITTGKLGEALGISQQAASREIMKLHQQGLIERQMGSRGFRISITEKGIKLLRREYEEYRMLFEPVKKLVIHGIVSGGLGEGRYYISQPKYRKQFQEKLLFLPYEGTLNLKIIPSDMPNFELLARSPGIRIEGFVSKGRTFGDVKCFLARIHDMECAVILPARTHYSDVMELIASRHLRSALSLKDGDLLEVTVELE